jgi:hypothetical protein
MLATRGTSISYEDRSHNHYLHIAVRILVNTGFGHALLNAGKVYSLAHALGEYHRSPNLVRLIITSLGYDILPAE